MSRRPCHIARDAITRAIKGAESAGKTVFSLDITRDGKIHLSFVDIGDTFETPIDENLSPDELLSKWERENQGG